MIKAGRTSRAFIVAAISIYLIACASSPDIDTRPALMLSAEKSLELGVSNYDENNFTKAEAHFDRALFLYRNIDNPQGITSSCLNIAKTKLSSGQVNEARTYAKLAQNIIQHEQLKQFNNRLTLIQSSIAIEDGNTAEAKQQLDDLLNETQANSNHAIRTAALQNRTRIAFIENTNTVDWVNQYKDALNKPGQNSTLNRARLLRFKAELTSEKETASANLSEALKLYREAAHSPGIAATLTESATHDLSSTNYQNATNKLERALFIRANLHDRKNSQKVLKQLTTSYNQLGKTNKSERAGYWQRKLDKATFEDWDAIRFEFESYPK